MPRRLRIALLPAVIIVALSAVAARAGYQPGDPPLLCAGAGFADRIGTNGPDAIEAGERPERLWGRAGTDFLYGSETRAACLLGGRDPDVLDLGGGGGAAWGEHGSDDLDGSPRDDTLDGGDGNDRIVALAGNDVITGGAGVDGIDAGAGDDLIESADGRAELVDCGPGIDTILADRADVLLGCESITLSGADPRRLTPRPRAARRSAIVRMRMRVPEAARAGAYRVLLVNACSGGPAVITRFPAPGRRVRRGQLVRVGLRPPAGGWCPGPVKTALLLYRRCASQRGCAAPPPPEAIARLQFRAG